MSAASQTLADAQVEKPMDGKKAERRLACLPIGELLDGPTSKLLNRPKRRQLTALVRGGSVGKDSLLGFFRSFDPRDRGRILKAAEHYDNLTKPKGKRNGALGYTGIKVLKALLEFIDYRSGRLDPSYLALCQRSKLCVSAVATALKRLVAHGFIELKRRYEETGKTDGGPPVRQITNAYRLMLPAVAAKMLRSPPPAPLSDDEIWRRRAEREERERMICQLPEWQRPVERAGVTDSSLAEVLNRLGRAVHAANERIADCDSAMR